MYDIIRVGEPLGDSKESFEEGMVFDIAANGANFRIAYHNIQKQEVSVIEDCNPVFSIIAINGVIFFLAKFGEIPWMDAPYDVHLSDTGMTIPDTSYTDGTGLALTVILVDAKTRIVQALRVFRLETWLSQRLKHLADEQRNKPFNYDKYRAKVKAIYARHSTLDLVKMSMQ